MFTWKILGVFAKDGLITSAKYYVSLSSEDKTIDTEGYWTFGDPILRVPFADVTEEMICDWIKAEAIQFDQNIIESRLTEQLAALDKTDVLPPWVPQVFTLGSK